MPLFSLKMCPLAKMEVICLLPAPTVTILAKTTGIKDEKIAISYE